MKSGTSATHMVPRDLFPLNLLLFLLPSSVFFWVLDGAIHPSGPQGQQSIPPSADRMSIVPSDALKKVEKQAKEVLKDFRELERQFLYTKSRNRALSLELDQYKAASTEANDVCSSAPASAPPTPVRSRRRRKHVKPEFQDFCDRVLESHRIRQQEKEIKKLQCALEASKKTRSSSAFDTFCQQVILTSELSKRRKEAKELREQVEEANRVRAHLAAQAQQSAALEAEKEVLVEELVKEVLEEAAESRRALDTLRAEHERDLREMANDWRKENTQLKREIEQLKLAHASRSLEQEISNELENRLFEGQPALLAEESETLDFADEGYVTDDTDGYLEDMTMMSSTSTCVGSPLPSPMKKQLRLLLSPNSRIDTSGFVGFSFNPRYFGTGDLASKRRYSASEGIPARPPWRV